MYKKNRTSFYFDECHYLSIIYIPLFMRNYFYGLVLNDTTCVCLISRLHSYKINTGGNRGDMVI